jgi:hypothetical protein
LVYESRPFGWLYFDELKLFCNLGLDEIEEYSKDMKTNEILTENQLSSQPIDVLDEEQMVAEFKNMLESCVSRGSERMVPNFTMDWIHSLRKKLAI